MQFVSGYWLDSEHIQAVVIYIKKGAEHEYLYNIYDNAPTANKIRKAIADGSLVIDEYNEPKKKGTKKK